MGDRAGRAHRLHRQPVAVGPAEPARRAGSRRSGCVWLLLVAVVAGYGLWRAARAARAGDEVAGLTLTGLVGRAGQPDHLDPPPLLVRAGAGGAGRRGAAARPAHAGGAAAPRGCWRSLVSPSRCVYGVVSFHDWGVAPVPTDSPRRVRAAQHVRAARLLLLVALPVRPGGGTETPPGPKRRTNDRSPVLGAIGYLASHVESPGHRSARWAAAFAPSVTCVGGTGRVGRHDDRQLPRARGSPPAVVAGPGRRPGAVAGGGAAVRAPPRRARRRLGRRRSAGALGRGRWRCLSGGTGRVWPSGRPAGTGGASRPGRVKGPAAARQGHVRRPGSGRVRSPRGRSRRSTRSRAGRRAAPGAAVDRPQWTERVRARRPARAGRRAPGTRRRGVRPRRRTPAGRRARRRGRLGDGHTGAVAQRPGRTAPRRRARAPTASHDERGRRVARRAGRRPPSGGARPARRHRRRRPAAPGTPMVSSSMPTITRTNRIRVSPCSRPGRPYRGESHNHRIAIAAGARRAAESGPARRDRTGQPATPHVRTAELPRGLRPADERQAAQHQAGQPGDQTGDAEPAVPAPSRVVVGVVRRRLGAAGADAARASRRRAAVRVSTGAGFSGSSPSASAPRSSAPCCRPSRSGAP